MKIHFKLAIHGIIGKAISIVTRRDAGVVQVSHVELGFRDGKCWSSLGTAGGCRFATLSVDDLTYISMDLKITAAEEDIVRAWCEDQVRHKVRYDWLDIVRFVFPFGEHDPDRLICSEACVQALQQIGWFGGVKAYRISPNALFELIGSHVNDQQGAYL